MTVCSLALCTGPPALDRDRLAIIWRHVHALRPLCPTRRCRVCRMIHKSHLLAGWKLKKQWVSVRCLFVGSGFLISSLEGHTCPCTPPQEMIDCTEGKKVAVTTQTPQGSYIRMHGDRQLPAATFRNRTLLFSRWQIASLLNRRMATMEMGDGRGRLASSLGSDGPDNGLSS